MKYDLSIIIPSRNEMFLGKTIEDILDKKRGKTQVIAVLDGAWADPVIKDHPDVVLVHYTESIGQRAAMNKAALLSEAKYIAKCDAHCGFDEGFDVKLMADMKDDWTMVPVMRNLHAFDWVCTKCGWRTYQGRTPIKCGWKKDRTSDWHKIGGCDAEGTLVRDFKWIGKTNPQSDSYTFDTEPHFQYFKEYRKRPEYKKMLAETKLTESMSLQGSFFMMTREKYWELNICDENFGSWGSQGIEISMKTRLSGGKVMISHKTWYAHMFRSQGGDFGFPYPMKDRNVQGNRMLAKDYFFNNKFEKAIYPLSKVIEEFAPIPGWSDEDYKNLKNNEMKVKRPGVYSIKNKASGKVYIGSAINLAQRFGEHLRRLRRKDHENRYLQSAWNKYGEDNFTFNIEYFCKENDLLFHEQRFIDDYKEKIGWRQMYNLNPEARNSLGRKHTPESLTKMSRQQSGEGNGFYGKKHTPESIEKMKEASKGAIPWNIGIPCSEETKEKISISQTGKEAWNKGLTKETDERVKEYADKLVGKKQPWEHNGMLGKTHTEEEKQRISETIQEVVLNRNRNESGQFINTKEDIDKLK